MFQQLAYGAPEQGAELLDRGQFNPCGRLAIQRGNRAAVQIGEPRNIRDAELVATHQGGEVAANHERKMHGVMRRITKRHLTHKPDEHLEAIGTWRRDSRGRVVIAFDTGMADEDLTPKIAEAVASILARASLAQSA